MSFTKSSRFSPRKTLITAIAAALVTMAVTAPSASAQNASVAISAFGNAGPGQMTATVSASMGTVCTTRPTGDCLGGHGTLKGVLRPLAGSCGSYSDPYYRRQVFLVSVPASGQSISQTFVFSVGTYTTPTGPTPIPAGPIKLCVYVDAAWTNGVDSNVYGGTFAQDERQATYGTTTTLPGNTGKRAAALTKCKKQAKKKRKKCRQKANKLPV